VRGEARRHPLGCLVRARPRQQECGPTARGLGQRRTRPIHVRSSRRTTGTLYGVRRPAAQAVMRRRRRWCGSFAIRHRVRRVRDDDGRDEESQDRSGSSLPAPLQSARTTRRPLAPRHSSVTAWVELGRLT